MTKLHKTRAIATVSAPVVETLERRALLAFGVTTTSTTFTVDNGADLKFTVLNNGAATSSTVHRGDITSIKYKNQEMLAPYATTTSKFYNMGRQMIENIYHGVTGTAGGAPVGAWMFMGNREHSAGGPFFKDIDFQSSSAVEIYNCVFTGHTQTESFRQGLQGP